MKPERGRGRGRGKGRGRGRGKSPVAKKDKTDKKGKENTKNAKGEKGDQENWWNEEWYGQYGHPDEYWAHEDWGSAGWSWDGYAWCEGQVALEEMSHEKQGKKRRNEGEGEETKQPATTHKRAKGARSLKSKEQETLSGASAEKPKKKCKKEKDEEEAEINQALLKKDTKEIQKYIALFSGKQKAKDVTDKLKEEIRSNLQLSELVEGRLNIYWKRPACGVHSRSQKFDLATFAIPDADDVNFVCRLAAAVKCGELFVTCLQTYVEKSNNTFSPMNGTEYLWSNGNFYSMCFLYMCVNPGNVYHSGDGNNGLISTSLGEAFGWSLQQRWSHEGWWGGMDHRSLSEGIW